ncbi:SPW repeat domain-containing protein [Leisingera thetidis]|uniref:SPW repeat domain-containing protein n=1 Tax=Leisingera thetidis TaxID=2930199 RepID=UPI0021F6F2CC|nr:SPW repeat protein [Leisingera thetidis]
MNRAHWQDCVSFTAGLRLLLAPLAFRIDWPAGLYLTHIAMNSFASGLTASALALLEMRVFLRCLELAILLLGLWITCAPWMLGFHQIPFARAQSLICGTALALMGGLSLLHNTWNNMP